eukprot:10261004-Alexandrium_andersonii.AAC.1
MLRVTVSCILTSPHLWRALSQWDPNSAPGQWRLTADSTGAGRPTLAILELHHPFWPCRLGLYLPLAQLVACHPGASPAVA